MEVRVGQWVKGTHKFINDIPRIRFIKVDKITDIFGRPHYQGKHKDGYSNNNMYIRKEDVIKVKDTPQELIEVGDLVGDKSKRGTVLEINHITDSGILKSFGTDILKGNIIKILTPNSNGGYDLQWEKNN